MNMKTLTIISFMCPILAVGSLVLSGCGGRATAAEGTVIAEFEWDGKHQITLEEMMEEISELPEYKQKKYQDKNGLEEYMTLMSESRLILCLAKDQKLDEDEEILKKVRDHLHALMLDKLTELEVEEKLVFTEDDYRLYYESHKEAYIDTENVELTCITLNDGDRAREVFEEIKAGKDIIEAATELSDHGELIGPGSNAEEPGKTGEIRRGSYPAGTEPFLDAAFSTEIGQIHDGVVDVTVRDKQYFMILRKDKHNQERQKMFDEEDVRKRVEKAVERTKRDELMEEWIVRLRDRAKIKLYSDRIPDTPGAEEGEAAEEDVQDSDESIASEDVVEKLRESTSSQEERTSPE